MTPGQRALRETARLEAAAFYGRSVGDASYVTREARACRDDAELDAAVERMRDNALITRSIELGATVVDLMLRYGLSRQEARRAIARSAEPTTTKKGTDCESFLRHP